jgi:hypothetical protein
VDAPAIWTPPTDISLNDIGCMDMGESLYG